MMLVIDFFFRVNFVAATTCSCLFLARAVIMLGECDDICLTLISLCRTSAKADYLFRSTVPYILTTCQTLTLIDARQNCLHFRFAAVLFTHSLFRPPSALIALARREEPCIRSLQAKGSSATSSHSGTGKQEHALLAIGRFSCQL